MSILRISLFGKFEVYWGQQVLTGLEARRVQELFCYLLLHRRDVHCRETLAGLLWGDSSAAQAKKYLRQALWQLQTALNCHPNPSESQVLLVDSEWVQLNTGANFQLDVAVFEQAFGYQ